MATTEEMTFAIVTRILDEFEDMRIDIRDMKKKMENKDAETQQDSQRSS